jgi:hypothetical protein
MGKLDSGEMTTPDLGKGMGIGDHRHTKSMVKQHWPGRNIMDHSAGEFGIGKMVGNIKIVQSGSPSLGNSEHRGTLDSRSEGW